MILTQLPAMLMCISSEACGEHRTCVTRGTAASTGIELHVKQNGVDQHGQNTVSKRSLDCMTTGIRLEARENCLVARTTVATSTRIVRFATSDRAGAVRLCGLDDRKVNVAR